MNYKKMCLIINLTTMIFLSGCSVQKKMENVENVNQNQSSEISNIQNEDLKNEDQYLKEDDVINEENLLGEWLYIQHGCIITFETEGKCNIMYEGENYQCTYHIQDDHILLKYQEKEVSATIHDDNMLYFNESKFGFMTKEMWDNSAIPEGENQNIGLNDIRNEMIESSAVLGVIFLGTHEGTPFDEEFLGKNETISSFDQYQFLSGIANENYAKNEGMEIYCLIPTDINAKVEVAHWDAMENKKGQILYKSEKGDPFWVQGNMSDIMSNLIITIEDSYGNKLEEYHPFISLENGKVSTYNPSNLNIIDYTITY